MRIEYKIALSQSWSLVYLSDRDVPKRNFAQWESTVKRLCKQRCSPVFLFSAIPGEEITFDYQLDCLDNTEKKPCYCGAANCSGFIGGKAKKLKAVPKADKKKKRKTPKIRCVLQVADLVTAFFESALAVSAICLLLIHFLWDAVWVKIRKANLEIAITYVIAHIRSLHWCACTARKACFNRKNHCNLQG